MPNPQVGITVRPLTRRDIDRVVEIHVEQFPTTRSTSLGRRFVRRMYNWFYLYQAELAIVAIEREAVVGFVTGAIGGYGRAIARYAFLDIVAGLIAHPKLLFSPQTYQLWFSYAKGLLAFQPPKLVPASPKRASIASIAVSNAFQRRGIGQQLASSFEAAAQRSGANTIALSVDRTNFAAIHLYESMHWTRVQGVEGASSIRFVKQLGEH